MRQLHGGLQDGSDLLGPGADPCGPVPLACCLGPRGLCADQAPLVTPAAPAQGGPASLWQAGQCLAGGASLRCQGSPGHTQAGRAPSVKAQPLREVWMPTPGLWKGQWVLGEGDLNPGSPQTQVPSCLGPGPGLLGRGQHGDSAESSPPHTCHQCLRLTVPQVPDKPRGGCARVGGAGGRGRRRTGEELGEGWTSARLGSAWSSKEKGFRGPGRGRQDCEARRAP